MRDIFAGESDDRLDKVVSYIRNQNSTKDTRIYTRVLTFVLRHDAGQIVYFSEEGNPTVRLNVVTCDLASCEIRHVESWRPLSKQTVGPCCHTLRHTYDGGEAVSDAGSPAGDGGGVRGQSSSV
eukprot:1391606-Amorphochlora_amoeboformis.AAC.1